MNPEDSVWPLPEDKNISALKIRMGPFGKGRIWIDGVELKTTRAVKFDASVNAPTIVTIEVYASVDLEAKVSEEKLSIEGETF